MKRIVSMTLAFIIAFSIFIPVEIVYAENIEEAGNILKELGVLSELTKKEIWVLITTLKDKIW